MARSCCLSQCQAPIQALLRPALWLPGVRNLHVAKETWEINNCTPQDAFDAILEAVNLVAEEENLVIKKNRKVELFLEIWSFTPGCNWLDIVDINLIQNEEGTIVETRSFSSGLLPACCPLAFIFNCLLFWVPFSGNNFNTHRLEAIRKAIKGLTVNVTEQGPSCC